MYLVRQSRACFLTRSKSCGKGLRLMSIYESLMVVINALKLIIDYIKLSKENKK